MTHPLKSGPDQPRAAVRAMTVAPGNSAQTQLGLKEGYTQMISISCAYTSACENNNVVVRDTLSTLLSVFKCQLYAFCWENIEQGKV